MYAAAVFEASCKHVAAYAAARGVMRCTNHAGDDVPRQPTLMLLALVTPSCQQHAQSRHETTERMPWRRARATISSPPALVFSSFLASILSWVSNRPTMRLLSVACVDQSTQTKGRTNVRIKQASVRITKQLSAKDSQYSQ
jgi:hypothetical protein